MTKLEELKKAVDEAWGVWQDAEVVAAAACDAYGAAYDAADAARDAYEAALKEKE